MVVRLLNTFLAVLLSLASKAQFAPAAGLPGSDALSANDIRFVQWATNCVIKRGYQDISNPLLGVAQVGNELAATGEPGQNGIVSLGDRGEATLTFSAPIYNGPGADFAVFENGFPTGPAGYAFLEFAFVEVSSNGIDFVRFPSVCNLQDTVQLAMEGVDCSLVHNLAGKYVAGWGTPFDLEELKDSAQLDINHVTHVRLIDVVGSLDDAYVSYDSRGNKINDPFPTPFPSAGFDLDAIGVIHAKALSIPDNQVTGSGFLYPNPVLTNQNVQLTTGHMDAIEVYDIHGRLLHKEENASVFRLSQAGSYIVYIQQAGQSIIQKLLVQ